MKQIVITCLVVLVMSYLIPGIAVTSFSSLIFFAIILSLLNATLGRLIKWVGCLINLLTLSLFNLVVNACMVQLTDQLIQGVHIDRFLTALLLALIISLANLFSQNKQTINGQKMKGIN